MALFGKDHSELLHQILRELGELRERVGGQQQALEQLRRESTAAINSGLTETRAVVRDGLHRHQEAIGDPLARIGTELVSIRAAISDSVRPAQPPTASSDLSSTDSPAEPESAAALLQAAAGISHVTIQAHRDTWAFLVEHAAGDRHFHVPGEVAEEAGAITVRISGPSLVAALTTLDRVHHTDSDPGTRAIAGHIHGRLTETVQDVIQRPHRGDGPDPVRIVIDDRIASVGDDQPPDDPEPEPPSTPHGSQ